MSDIAVAERELGPGIIWPKDRHVRTDDGADLAYTFLGRTTDR